ncbi:MAG TPA: hypothetical protein VM537_32900, partial [Anaerolineae bacterium]|nr:hypothetical protein [Anaerolineae bacterium]
MVLRYAPPARPERATYGFERLKDETREKGRSRPADYALGTLPSQSPYAVSGADNGIAHLPLSANLRDCRLAAMGRGGLGSG